ncbi:MAG: adenylate cyclase [Spirochaetaceae bacterium]|nr:adenylate cyclase [Spirochaetaceae bacterium]|tara:strand:- start:20611 stop:21951 length:1341 start_codon:yes stop_codon:yes gene_type:complete
MPFGNSEHRIETVNKGTVQDILKQEEVHGAVMGNRFRYGAIVFIGVAITWNTLSLEGTGVLANILSFAAFALVTVLHSLILKWGNNFWIKAFNYITLLFDYVLISGLIVFWTLAESPDNAAFAIKNPTNLYFLIPLLIPTFQFRIKYVVISYVIFILIHLGSIAISFHLGAQATNSWYSYVMGEGIILADIIPTRPMLFGLVALTAGLTIRRSLNMLRRLASAEAQKTILSRYFSPELAERLTSRPDQLRTGDRRYVTILFSDIRGFTTLSEHLPPEDLARMLTEYRELVTEIIFKHGGMIDKFIGDAVMAVFGVPESKGPQEDAKAAVACGKEMLTTLPDFNKELAKWLPAKLDIGIGLHCGEVFAGTIGAENRLEYTVLGDTVNTASRLESLCKRLGRRLIVSKELVDQAGATGFESVARVQVRGRSQPVQVFTPVGFPLASSS